MRAEEDNACLGYLSWHPKVYSSKLQLFSYLIMAVAPVDLKRVAMATHSLSEPHVSSMFKQLGVVLAPHNVSANT